MLLIRLIYTDTRVDVSDTDRTYSHVELENRNEMIRTNIKKRKKQIKLTKNSEKVGLDQNEKLEQKVGCASVRNKNLKTVITRKRLSRST